MDSQPSPIPGDHWETDRAVQSLSHALDGQHILLVVTGGIAALLSPLLARELRRHGAKVEATMTRAAREFIGDLCLEWATTNPVTTGLTGKAEQTRLHDLILVSPCTLNAVGKMAAGIADDAALTSIGAAFGAGIPVVIVPTMHESLWHNPIFRQNLHQLQKAGLIQIVPPLVAEGKAKYPGQDAVIRVVRRALSRSPIKGRRILLTAGPTRGPIDAVRYIQNRSSGRLGCLLAAELDARGAEVTLIYGPGTAIPPKGVELVPVETPRQMLDAVLSLGQKQQPFAAIFAAAVLDYVPTRPRQEKLPSGGELQVEFQTTPKIILEADKLRLPWIKVGFKLEAGLSDAELMERGSAFLRRSGVEIAVCNRLEDVSIDGHRGVVLTASSHHWAEGRQNLVHAIAAALEEKATH